jgi:hypothetical protein
MAGKLYVDEIRDVATIGSPAFPNGLNITNLTDPVGSEGDLLTVQADGTILAEAAAGAGIPITVSGITDLSDAEEVVTAILAAMPPLTYTGTYDMTFLITPDDGSEQALAYVYADGGASYAISGVWTQSGPGSVLVWGMRWDEP